MTKFQPIEIPPGVVVRPTKNMRSSNWAETNLMRWVEGEMQPVGGQSRYAYSFASRCKAIHAWSDLSGNRLIAYVCEQNVYVDAGGLMTGAGGYGDLNYNDSTYGTARASGGILIEITPAGGWPAPAAPGAGGYGDLNYSDDVYGTARASSSILSTNAMPNVWSVDNFGAILLVMYSADQRLLQWDPAAGGLLTVVAGAPQGRLMVVTQERFIQVFGATIGTPLNGSARRFAWCDQENMLSWNYSTVTSQAGFLDVEPASPIITAIAGKFGTLFFTAKKAYISRYIGLPYVYDYHELCDDCTPWSPASIVTTSSLVLWMAPQGAFSFDGSSISPQACLVRPWIMDDVDPAWVREEACAVHVGAFSEVWWFFPQNGQHANTRVAIYNYKEGWWSQGQMSRSAGTDSSYTAQPIMADGLVAYQHELGPAYSADATLPYAETFDLNLTSGVRLATVKQMLPDIKGDANVQFRVAYRNSRSTGAPQLWQGPLPLRSDGYVDVRVTGRDIRMRIEAKGPTVKPFTVGQHLVDFAVRGDR